MFRPSWPVVSESTGAVAAAQVAAGSLGTGRRPAEGAVDDIREGWAVAADLSQIVKAYDVRGVVPDQWDESLAELFGAAFVRVTRADAIVVGHDMRPSSPGLSAAFARGAAALGADVTLIGLCSTDQLYYASGALDLPGAMFTASHNPAQYNGIKMCRAGAAPVGQDTGLAEIRELAEQWPQQGAARPGADRGHDHASATR